MHRLQSRWSQEGRLLSQTLEDLQLETSWTMDAVRCERFGQVGSMPVNHYFPFLAVEDTKNHVFWGAQLAHPASWQMEIYRLDENIAVSGGLADREFGHWVKELAPGERFASPEAIVTVAYLPPEAVWGAAHEDGSADQMSAMITGYEPDVTGLDLLCGRLTEAGERAADEGPESEQELPIIFGHASSAFHQTEHLLKKDGMPLTTCRRRFWDMQDPWVQDYLRERVIGTLKRYGFEFLTEFLENIA